MKNSGSSSRTNKPIVIAILVLLTPLLARCKQDIYFGTARDALQLALSRADYSFFASIDKQHPPGNEIFSFSPGAGLFFGLAARTYGDPDLAERFLFSEWEKGEEPYAREAVGELLDYYNRNDLYEKTIPLAEECLKKYSGSPFAERAAFWKIEAVYWQKKDEATLALIKEQFPGPRNQLKEEHAELLLFQTVAETRLGKPEWQKQVREFFFTLRASVLHWRFYTFLEKEKEKLAAFTPLERELFEAKSLLGNGQSKEALKKYENLLPRFDSKFITESTLIQDFTSAALSGGAAAKQGALLLSLAGKLDETRKPLLHEAAGRIYLAAYQFTEARREFELVLAAASDPDLKKRLLWRLCKIALRGTPEEALKVFRQFASRWDDPGYYADVIDEFLSLLVRSRRFKELLSLEASMKSFFPEIEQAQLSYICARALQENLVKTDGENREEKIESLFAGAHKNGTPGYYDCLSAYFMKKTAELKIPFGKKTAPSGGLNDQEKLLKGFLQFGLYNRALSHAAAFRDQIRDETFSALADTLRERDRSYESIRLLGFIRERGKTVFSENDYKNYYPKPFGPLVVKYASEYGIDEHLFFALIRQESAFHPGIASHAGAVGLTQLMPKTGDWIARELKMDSSDLTNPAISILFSAYYLSFLTKRLQTVPQVLAGYNAGPTKTRSWKREYGDLPLDLFVEAADYGETRNFIKSIFTSHFYYNIIFHKGTLAQSVELFFK